MKKDLLVRFNVQNAKYALPAADGTTAAPVSFPTSRKIALEPNASKKKIYGDGRVIGTIVNDKGKTGTLTSNNISDEYEIAMGRKLRTAKGLADIRQRKDVKHHIYFETCGLDADGGEPIAKTWVYNATSSRPSESYDQTTDDTNETTFDIPLEIFGIPVISADGKPYKDEKGNIVYAWQMTVTPDDPGFDTFGDAVVFPIMPSEVEGENGDEGDEGDESSAGGN